MGGLRADDFAALQFLQDCDHVERGGLSEAVLLIFGELAGGTPTFGLGESGPVAADFAHGAGVLEAEAVEVGVDGVGGEPLEDHIGCGVVAEDDHEIDDVAQGKLDAVGELGADDAAAGDFVLRADGKGFVPAGFACGHLVEDGEKDGELDGAGGAHGVGGSDSEGLAGVEVFGVKGDGALDGGNAGAHGLLEGLRAQDGKQANDKEEDAHDSDDTAAD